MTSIQGSATAFLAFVLLAAPLPSDARQSAKVSRTSLLVLSPPATMRTNLDASWHGLRELGHAEGQNVPCEIRSWSGPTT